MLYIIMEAIYIIFTREDQTTWIWTMSTNANTYFHIKNTLKIKNNIKLPNEGINIVFHYCNY